MFGECFGGSLESDNLRSYIEVQRYVGVLSGKGDVEGFYEGSFDDVSLIGISGLD